MDEYEVDLMDYLEVMWKGKWIILACLVVAIAASVAIMWTTPDEYAVSVQYQYHDQLLKLLSARQSSLIAQLPSASTVQYNQLSSISIMQDNALLMAVEPTQLPASDEKMTKKVESADGSVKVTISSSAAPNTLSQAAESFTSSLEKELDKQMSNSVLLAIDSADLNIVQLERERDMLQERMTEAMATNDPLTEFLAEKIAELEAQIVQYRALTETLQAADASALFRLDAAQRAPSRVGPNRKMSVAVAGVLGLFVGVLLAFFIHYLQNARSKKQEKQN